MANIFISYARADRQTAEKFVAALEAQNWDVFWDKEIPAGKRWSEIISRNLAAAECVVVLWSRTSVVSDPVLDEAEIGRKRQVLVPIFIEENIDAPFGFGRVQTANLAQWNGDVEDAGFQKLVSDISAFTSPRPVGAEENLKAQRIQQVLFKRQQFRDRYTLLLLLAGGGLGSGAAVFLLRAILGFAVMDFGGLTLSVAFAFGINAAVLGAALSFGIALSGQLWKAVDARHQKRFAWLRIFQRRGLLAITLGASCFVLAHTTMAVFNGMKALSGEALKSIVASLGAGIALSFALRDLPEARLRLNHLSWFWRLGIVALTFVIVQVPFSFKRFAGTGLTMVGSADFYRYHFVFWGAIPTSFKLPAYLSEVDACLMGAALSAGVIFGIARAANLLARWLKVIDAQEPGGG
jgi:hypothetical protein